MSVLTFITNKLARKPGKATIGGTEYVVAPVVMINEGVLPGSQGAIYYPSTVVGQRTHRWNNIPVTLGHPEDSKGNKISARSPKVADRYTVGYVFNVHRVGKKLKGQAYLDRKLMQQRAPATLRQIEQGRPVELSTGLYTSTVAANGQHNGKRYTQKLVGYEPDHLAILIDQEGACSLKDGCGVNTNSLTVNAVSDSDKRQALQLLLEAECDKGSPDKEGRYPGDYVYVVDVYPSYVVYRKDKATYKRQYKLANDKVQLVGEAQQVVMTRTYRPISKTKTAIDFIPTTTNAGCTCKGKCKKCRDAAAVTGQSIQAEFVRTANANCGIGSGGFQPGNKCASGGGKKGKKGSGPSNKLSSKDAQSLASKHFGKKIAFGTSKPLKNEDGERIGTRLSFPKGYKPRLKGRTGEVFAKAVEIIPKGDSGYDINPVS